MMTYEWEEGMGEISGFGGGYEEACRKMLKAGCKWLDANPKADPKFHGFEGVYGILDENNQDAKNLSKAVVSASGDDCTGAMHQAAISHILFIRKNGWEKYAEEMKHRKNNKKEE